MTGTNSKAPAVAPVLWLSVVKHNDESVAEPIRIEFGPEGGTIGRRTTCTLVLPDPQRVISSVQACIEFRTGDYLLVDLGSNPLLLNGRAIGGTREARLADGDLLVIGAYHLKVTLSECAGGLQGLPGAHDTLAFGDAIPDDYDPLRDSSFLAPYAADQPPITGDPMADRAAPPSIFTAVDDALAKMQLANIAFNSPSPINIDDTAKIELCLDLHLAPEILKRMITAPGEVKSAQVKVSNRMTAHLSGSEFDITASTPETQAVSGKESTVWVWTIKPKTAGNRNLHLNLDAIFLIDGGQTPRTIRTFSTAIQVTVTPAQRITIFAKGHWQWLSATILIPIVTWWWNHRH